MDNYLGKRIKIFEYSGRAENYLLNMDSISIFLSGWGGWIS
jgi:hypothetical protein